MTAGRHPNYFNESFFDKQSKIMLYFLGGSFSIYRCKMIPKKTEGYSFINQWQSSNKNWIEKLKLFLESEHKITTDLSRRIGKKDLFKTHTLNITSQRMHYALKEYHLNKHKTEILFPENINPYLINHFIRGFADVHFSACNVYLYERYKNKGITIHYNEEFNSGLEKVLVEHAGIKPKKVVTDTLRYCDEDVKKFHDFIYKDIDFIERSGLYLLGKKEKFEA